MYFSTDKLLADGTKVTIQMMFNDSTKSFEITDVAVLPKRKRKAIWLSYEFRDRSEYRRLNHKNSVHYRTREFAKRVGIDVLNQALKEAWESIKPELWTTAILEAEIEGK